MWHKSQAWKRLEIKKANRSARLSAPSAPSAVNRIPLPLFSPCPPCSPW